MKDIIERIAIFCFPTTALKSTSRYMLSLEEQHSLIINGNYRQCKKAMKLQKFDDELLKLLAKKILCEYDGSYKLLMLHYKTYGFSFEFERCMVLCYCSRKFRPFLGLLLDEYGFGYKESYSYNQFYELYCDLDAILEFNNPNIAAFFKGAKKTGDLLTRIKQAYLQNKVTEEYGSWVPYPAAHFGELFYNIFAYQGIIPLTEKEQKKELLKVFPSHEAQEAILAVGNLERLWIKKLAILASLTKEAWMEAFGEFDDSLLCQQTKALLED